jgi:hypothetical protein
MSSSFPGPGATAAPAWLAVFSPLPDGLGDCQLSEPDPDASTQIRLTLGERRTGQRIVTARYDFRGRLVTVTDMVLLQGGHVQECARAVAGAENRGNGTHWRSEGSHHSPRPLLEHERTALLALAVMLRRRVDGPG